MTSGQDSPRLVGSGVRIPERPSITRLVRERLWGDAQVFPSAPLPVVRRSADDFARPPLSGLRITWLGHSTSLIELDGHRFLTDPVWVKRASPVEWVGPRRFFDPPLPLDELPEIDAVLISHDHYDHLDRHTVLTLAKRGHMFVVPTGVGARLTRWGVAAEQIRELEWFEGTRVGDVEVVATPGRHFSGRSPFGSDRNRALWAGFALIGPEHRVYYAGDTAMFGGFEEIGAALGPFDATLIEIGAYNRMWADLHLGPEQAVEAYQRVGGGLLVPVHWATFNLAFHSWTEPAERLIVEADRTGAEFVIPRPGQSVEPSCPPPVERWWPEIPWETAAEHPIVSSPEGTAHRVDGWSPLPRVPEPAPSR